MSGHSHWATIKRKKEASDQQRGKIFSKLSREITIAVKDGADPETNFKLRLAIEKAKRFNMPKENISRAIKKATGEGEGGRLEELNFEGYGPGGIAVVVEAITDNKNRTTAELKNIFEKGGGNLAAPGAVSFQFKKSGFITVEKGSNVEEQILKLIDLGAEEVEEATDAIEVYSSPEKLNETKEKILNAGFKVKDTELTLHPTTPLVIDDKEKAVRVLKFMENLESHDDVQKVYANFDIPDEVLEQKDAPKNQ